MKEILIEWSGPYSYEEIINQTEKNEYSVKPSDKGLYQIYGAHPVYGNRVLIYIGKTEKPFSNRLKGRRVILDNIDSENVQIYLGKIFNDHTLKCDVSSDIARAESLLIHYHKPAHNSSNINTLKYADKNIRVINIGSYRDLHIEISTRAFTKELKIYSMIDSIAEDTGIVNNKFARYNDEYGYFLDKDETIWFGVDYELWDSEVTLVLMSDKNIDKHFKEFNYIDIDEKGYFKPLYGEKEDIIEEISKYKALLTLGV